MHLYIVRHAEPDYENDTLTAAGELEAKALAQYLQVQGVDYIYSSPMGRALKTMSYTSELLGIEPRTENWLRELTDLWIENSPWGYIGVFDIPGEVIRNGDSFPTHETWHQLNYYQEVQAKKRVEEIRRSSDRFLLRHGYERMDGRYSCINPSQDKIVVFCHRAIGLTWLGHLLDIPISLMWSGFWMPPSSVTTVVLEQRSDRWATPRCIGFGDTSHIFKHDLMLKAKDIHNDCFVK